MNVTQKGKDLFYKELKHFSVAMLVTTDKEQSIHATPLWVAKVDEDCHMWFFCKEDSMRITEIGRNPKVNLSMSSFDRWISMTGKAKIHMERNKMEHYWIDILYPYFPKGIETPGLRLIEVKPQWGEYWNRASIRNKASYVYQATKSVVLGRQIDTNKIGQHEKIALSKAVPILEKVGITDEEDLPVQISGHT
eukprot:TRINITY_DN336_c0_g1_i2.p1 TRINITY_DN336_c0_g1~~TRINITY_DN336_c0_g1_i2.p1  ORF type:complete len:193 (+),score=22.81 TRINITY_DN336_c0_g1_i2:65-643(+)